MTYVTWVFQKLFGYSQEKAERLMLDVHHKGRAIVTSGPRERMEYDATRLHGYGRGYGRSAMMISGARCGMCRPLQRPRGAGAAPVHGELAALLAEQELDRDDPANRTALPDVYPEDQAEADEFRRYTEDDLKASKLDQAKTVLVRPGRLGGGAPRR